jgi:Protein of unknown function (DUF1569)
MDTEKYAFIQTGFVTMVQQLTPDAMGKWGKMNAWQMVEHVTDFFNISNGRLRLPIVTPAGHLPKLKAFLLSDKEFRENTKAPLEILGEDPLPLRSAAMEAAIAALQKSIDVFVDYYKDDAALPTSHPVFGTLNFEEWVLLHYKHLVHHARQFGLV